MDAFTIGNPLSYEPTLDSGEVVWKTGRTKNYAGGWVFGTVEEAIAWLDRRDWQIPIADNHVAPLTVYRLELPGSWDESTYQAGDGPRRLAVDAIVKRADLPRANMLDHPLVVRALVDMARLQRRTFAEARRAAVAVVAKTAPFEPQDLARSLGNLGAMGISIDELVA